MNANLRSACLLAIDQGTTSTRAMVFDGLGNMVCCRQQEFQQYFPRDGWVEHDPEEIWESVVAVGRAALAGSGVTLQDIAGVGITNQRETTLLWDRESGQPVYNAIVWQDRRTAGYCRRIDSEAISADIQARTGLLLDPYFSATKLRWLLDNVDGTRERALSGELLFGTIDTFLVWRLTGGRRHVTDATNASRTLMFNIHRQCWDSELLALFDIPECVLPEVLDCTAEFGITSPELFGSPLPIRGVAGDQQAALVGQACFQPGMCKSTYGTGCFMINNTGATAVASTNRLLTTVAYRLDGDTTYALEGSIFMAGATMQWLRDGVCLLDDVAESMAHAERTGYDNAVYLVPAFTGLGAPHWNPDARGAIVGLTRDTGISEIITAGLQSVCYQTRDLLEAMDADGVEPLRALRVDGGMVANDWFNQFLADILGVPVERPANAETTAQGAAMLAGLQAGVFTSLEDIASRWQGDRKYTPSVDKTVADKLYTGWSRALAGVLHMST